MRLRRFKVERITESGLVQAEADQIHHARNVLRLEKGDEVCVFDGEGNEAIGTIDVIVANHLTVHITRRLPRVVPISPRLFIATAIPKGQRADWLIEKCAELGVEEIVPLRCARAQVVPGIGKIERWRRKADEAAKQSGQAVVMRVDPVRALTGAIVDAAARGPFLFGDPRGNAPSLLGGMEALKESDAAPLAATIFIGPEGGFTQDEVRELESGGGRPVRLAGSVLRIETAAVAAAAVWASMEW